MIIVMLDVDQIDVGDRLRPVDEDFAALIGASMAQYGQRAPIEVLPQVKESGKYPLISGGHRLRGAHLAGMTTIAAIVRDVDDLTAELLEIDENLSRHELNPFDEAVFLARRKEIWLGMYPETATGKAKKKNDKLSFFAESFATVTARKLGVDVRTIERRVQRSQDLLPGVPERIRGTWIATRGAYLDAIIKLPGDEQRAVVDLLLGPDNEDRSITVHTAIGMVRGASVARRDDTDKQFQALMRTWKRCSLVDQAKFLREIGAKIAGGRS